MLAQNTASRLSPGGMPWLDSSAPLLVEAPGYVLSLQRDQCLFTAGDAAKSLYRVRSGCLRSFSMMPDGRRQVVDFHLAGDLFGIEDSDERLLGVEAVTDTVLLRYAHPLLTRQAVQDPRTALYLHELTCRKLHAAQRRLMVLGRKTAAERVAGFLLEMADRTGSPRFDLPMARHDIADHLGLTLETVSRVLSALRRQKLIRLPTPQRVELASIDALSALTGDA